MNEYANLEAHGMDVTYRVVLEPEPNRSAYNVIVPAFPTAHTWGETVEEALAHAREIIELEIEDRTERGEPLPPSDVETLLLKTITVEVPAA
jgi:predicted RNase H-like HicB family nuclease